MKISRRRYCWYILLTVLITVGVLSLLGAPLINSLLIHSSKFKQIYTWVSVVYVSAISSALIIKIILCKGVRNLYNRYLVLRAVEDNIIKIGAYEECEDRPYVILPKIKVTNDTVIICYKDIRIREIVDRYIELFSTALPNQFVVEEHYVSKDSNDLIIKYEDIEHYEKEKYSLIEYVNMIKQNTLLDIYFDRKHTISLLDYPHWLITGTSGSGKSYLAQQILMQAIIKDFEIVIMDIKRSYGFFKKYVDCYSYEVDDILETLRQVETEMTIRLENLQTMLDLNPRATAIDIGYKPKLIVIEEYISLQSSVDKKTKEELERIVKNLSVMARVTNIHLLICMQSAGTESIQASTRHNLSKIILGMAQSNILTSTFGTGVNIPYQDVRMDKGEGLIQTDRITMLRVPEITDMEHFDMIIGGGACACT